MRLFPKLVSCWGGAVVRPAADVAAVSGRQTDEQGRTTKRLARVRSGGGAVTHWKPRLNAISEENQMTEVDRRDRDRRTARIDVKPKSSAKVKPRPIRSDDYWRSSEAMSIPAFTPAFFF